MEPLKLNYGHRFPRFKFKNGETKYGMLYSFYNKQKKRLEHYFAEANQIRRSKSSNKAIIFNYVKELKNKININDVEQIEYLT
ncbi:MAG: hypothetical protein ACJAZ2_002372 [Glaciecola sp.]|jgi:hypothetical protein